MRRFREICENFILLYENTAGKDNLSYESCSLCYEKPAQAIDKAWAGPAEGMCDDGSKGGSCFAPQMSLTAWVSTCTLWAHHCAAWWLVIWLEGKLKVPARPLVRKL